MNNIGQFFQRHPAGGIVVQIQLHPRGDAFSVGVPLYMKKIADFRQVQVEQPHEIPLLPYLRKGGRHIVLVDQIEQIFFEYLGILEVNLIGNGGIEAIHDIAAKKRFLLGGHFLVRYIGNKNVALIGTVLQIEMHVGLYDRKVVQTFDLVTLVGPEEKNVARISVIDAALYGDPGRTLFEIEQFIVENIPRAEVRMGF